MKKALLIGGWNTDESKGFLPWLVTNLQTRGYLTTFVELPHNLLPLTKSGVAKTLKVFGSPDEDTIIICHSFGARVALRYLETVDRGIGAIIMIAPLYDCITFTSRISWRWKNVRLNTDLIRRNCDKRIILHSQDDNLVPHENGEALARLIEAELISVNGYGHFCHADKCYELPLLLQLLDLNGL